MSDDPKLDPIPEDDELTDEERWRQYQDEVHEEARLRREEMRQENLERMRRINEASLKRRLEAFLSIPDDEWEAAVAADEAAAAAAEQKAAPDEPKANRGKAMKGGIPAERWHDLVAPMSNVMKMAHLAMRKTDDDVAQIRKDLVRARRKAFEDELTTQARLAGCEQRRGHLSNGAILSEIGGMSQVDAQRIVNTYNRDLAYAVRNIRESIPRANRHTYAARMKAWEAGRDTWKRGQIEQHTEGSARALAQQWFYDMNSELLAGYGELEPKTAVCPVCQGWVRRGKVPIRETVANPPPYHVGCPHKWKQHPRQVADCALLWVGE